MMRTIVALNLCLVTASAFGLSDNGCQCTSECKASGGILSPLDPNTQCDVESKYCPGSPNGRDGCPNVFEQAANSVRDFFSASFSGTSITKVKGWDLDKFTEIDGSKLLSQFGDLQDTLGKFSSAQLRDVDVSQITATGWAGLKTNLDAASEWSEAQWQKVPVGEIATFTEDQLNKIPIGDLNIEQFKKIDGSKLLSRFGQLQDTLGKFNPAQLKDVNVSQITETGWASLKTNLGAMADWTQDQLQKIPVGEIATFTADQLQKIPTEKITQFSVDQMKAIPYDRIGTVLKGGWDKVPVENVAQFAWEQLQQIPYEEIGSVLDANWDKVPLDKLIKLTGEQINKIPADELKGLQTYWNMVPVGQVAKFAAETLQAIGVENIDPEKIGQVSNTVWDKVPVGQISKLSAQALQKIDYEGLATFTKEQWNNVPFEKYISLAGTKVRAIPAEDVHAWTEEQWDKVPVDKIIMFTGEQMNSAAVLGKLSIDAVSEWAKTGKMNATLLGTEAKAQLTDLIAKAGGQEEFEAEGAAAIGAIEAHDEAEIVYKAKVLELDVLSMTPGVTEEQLTAAKEEVRISKTAVDNSKTAVQALGYLKEPEPEEKKRDDGKDGTDGNTAGMVFPAMALSVFPFFALWA